MLCVVGGVAVILLIALLTVWCLVLCTRDVSKIIIMITMIPEFQVTIAAPVPTVLITT